MFFGEHLNNKLSSSKFHKYCNGKVMMTANDTWRYSELLWRDTQVAMVSNGGQVPSTADTLCLCPVFILKEMLNLIIGE